MKYKVSSRTQTVTENTTLLPEGYGGWYCQNIGTVDAEVNGYKLSAGEVLDAFAAITPDVIWNSPIAITFTTAEGAALRITRLQYTEEV